MDKVKLRYYTPFLGIFLAKNDKECMTALILEEKYEAFFVYHVFVACAICSAFILL